MALLVSSTSVKVAAEPVLRYSPPPKASPAHKDVVIVGPHAHAHAHAIMRRQCLHTDAKHTLVHGQTRSTLAIRASKTRVHCPSRTC